jgi:hypothetical protein
MQLAFGAVSAAITMDPQLTAVVILSSVLTPETVTTLEHVMI